MSQRIQAAVEEDMPKLTRKIRKKIPITDGLGICRSCINLSTPTCTSHALVGSISYFEAACAASRDRCHKTRRSLLECQFYTTPQEPKKNYWKIIIDWFRSLK